MIHAVGTIVGLMMLIFGTLFIIAIAADLFTRRPPDDRDWYW